LSATIRQHKVAADDGLHITASRMSDQRYEFLVAMRTR
jgi:hypothetical protein